MKIIFKKGGLLFFPCQEILLGAFISRNMPLCWEAGQAAVSEDLLASCCNLLLQSFPALREVDGETCVVGGEPVAVGTEDWILGSAWNSLGCY